MISNERSFVGGFRLPARCAKTPVQENTLTEQHIQIERKSFAFVLKENPRGCLLRITEEVGGKRNTIIIPAPGLAQFRNVLDQMIGMVPAGDVGADAER
jgi:hypothetical protein